MGTAETADRRMFLAEVIERDDRGQPSRVRVSGEASDDVVGQSYGHLGQTEEDVEGQLSHWGLHPEDEDVEGQSVHWGLHPEDEDVEGQISRWGLFPAEADAEGHVLVIGEGIPGAENMAGKTFRVEEEDVEGQTYSHLGQTEEDVQGQTASLPPLHPPVD